jgi:TetR/AcrR family transcriptional regulator
MADSNTEQRILDAAKEVFMKYGLYGARMQDIANTAGINKALLHYYFRNKEKLFDQVFEGALERYFEQINVFSDVNIPLIDRVNRYVENAIGFFSEYPQMSIFIIKEIGANPVMFKQKVSLLKKGYVLTLFNILQEEKAAGKYPALDPIIFIMNLHSLCAYPFIASAIFKSIIEKNQPEWADPGNRKLIASVKEFVASQLTVNSTDK